jgi:hypothetical protein
MPEKIFKLTEIQKKYLLIIAKQHEMDSKELRAFLNKAAASGIPLTEENAALPHFKALSKIIGRENVQQEKEHTLLFSISDQLFNVHVAKNREEFENFRKGYEKILRKELNLTPETPEI